MRKIKGQAELESVFALLLSLSRRVREQRKNQRGPKVYSLDAPEVECIGKGNAHRPYEFGVKGSIATTLHHFKGGQFIAHLKALPGNPYDGHTLEKVLPDIEEQVGGTLSRIVADCGYRGHNAPPDHRFKVLSPARSDASPNISSASCDGAPPSNRSSATPKASIGWAAIIWPANKATPSTPS